MKRSDTIQPASYFFKPGFELRKPNSNSKQQSPWSVSVSHQSLQAKQDELMATTMRSFRNNRLESPYVIPNYRLQTKTPSFRPSGVATFKSLDTKDDGCSKAGMATMTEQRYSKQNPFRLASLKGEKFDQDLKTIREWQRHTEQSATNNSKQPSPRWLQNSAMTGHRPRAFGMKGAKTFKSMEACDSAVTSRKSIQSRGKVARREPVFESKDLSMKEAISRMKEAMSDRRIEERAKVVGWREAAR